MTGRGNGEVIDIVTIRTRVAPKTAGTRLKYTINATYLRDLG
eukprot:CAMPEP_0115555726 /NCGR_PEP_ID=MMETSP0271-20121206/97973_1 /TAXON_ID=71861 /ORGANISM="Scrippsiella trochoidea, Strain CCMP3099" /LENGTH=41 /DNA_ID= /DNA_START= /DNA_END= /DNA_ORIENTATION=